MSTTAVRGYGTKFRKVSGTNQTAVSQIRDLEGPGAEADDIDISNTQSTNRRREFIAGMVDEGEITFDMVFTKAQYNTLKGYVGPETNDSFEIEFSDRTATNGTGSILALGGYVKALGPSMPFEDKVTADCTVKVSGETTFTPSA